MSVKIKDTVSLLSNNYKNSDNWTEFYYLDTGNLTNNIINNLAFYTSEKNLPSRAKQKPLKGIILYSSVRPNQYHFGYVEKEIRNLIVSTGFIMLKPKEHICGKYVYYYLTQKVIVNKLANIAENSKSSYPSITADDILNLNINIPSLDTQCKISNLLSMIDDQINLNNTIVKRLQVLSHAIFNKFFSSESMIVSLVDFPYIQILKPGIIKFEGAKHYIATAEVEGDRLNLDAPLIEYRTRENRANMQPIQSSVWFAKMKRSVKHIYIPNQYDDLINNYVFSTGFCGIKCDEIAFEYMINYLNMPYFETEKDSLSHGATMEGVNNEDLKFFKIHLPSKEDLIAFHIATKNIHCRISRIEQMSYKLTCLKENLLPLLINGQLR